MTTTQGLLRKIEGLKSTLEAVKKKGVQIRIAAPITKEAEKAGHGGGDFFTDYHFAQAIRKNKQPYPGNRINSKN